MATETANLKLNKPDVTEFYDLAVQNGNMDKIDHAFENKVDKEDLPTSLPANGGNADTVDNKHAIDFASSVHSHTKSDIGLGSVDNTADANKSVKYAASAGSAANATTAGTCTGNSASSNYATSAGNADTVDGLHGNTSIGSYGLKPISAGTTDLVAGTSTLVQGHIYLVYE